MKIAITGATGFIGKQLVPLLSKNDNKVLLIGRNKTKSDKLFPEHEFCEYEDMQEKIFNFELLINLSVLNNNLNKSLKDFLSINVDLSMDIFKKAKNSNVKNIINFSTVHCLDQSKVDNYTLSKRILLNRIEKDTNLNVISVLLPAVYGEKFANKLSFLNKFPNRIRKKIFKMISAIKATVNINYVYKYIISDSINRKSTIILSSNQDNNFYYKAYNKLLDIGFAFCIIVFFGWLLILILFLVKISSKGPAIYRQKRVGKSMKEFICYKFRTMKVNTPNLATHQIEEDYVTKVGLFLRKYKLDELPQVVNILKGEMSLVGPRPCLPNQIELIKERDERNIFTIKPGISGWAAVNNVDMSNPKLLAQTDEEYLKLRSISLDIKIIIKTLLGSGFVDRTK